MRERGDAAVMPRNLRALTRLVVLASSVAALSAACDSSETSTTSGTDGGSTTGFDAGSTTSDSGGTTDSGTTPTDAGSDAPTDSGADAKDGGGCVTPPAGIISWWTGDDTPADRMALHNMTVNGGVTYAAGKVGKAFSFASGAFLETPHAADLVLDEKYTIEAWVNIATFGGRVVDHITAGIADGYLLDTYPSNVRAYAGVPVVIGGTSLAAMANTWIHIAAVFDGAGGTLTVYLNGAMDGQVAATSPSVSNTHTLRIGADSSGNNPINGLADEVTIYDRALSGAEIKAIYDAGSAGKCK